ncbi:hypothetical protein M378DRAFT_89780, partial [Amanita muscaria Koide BX008]
ERVAPYSDTLFRESAIGWIVETDQAPFKKMVHVAARAGATNDVKIPSRKQTRKSIIDTFKTNIRKLRQLLSVRINSQPFWSFTYSVRATPAKDVSTSHVMLGKHLM